MFRQYYFADSRDGLKVRHYIGLFLLTVVLGWKLLRGISPDPLTWHAHVGLLGVLALASSLTFLQNHGRIRTFDMSLAVFVFCVFVVLRMFVYGNYRDPFTVASVAFFGHLFLTSLFTRVSDSAFFRGISFLFTGLVIIEIIGMVEYVYGWGIVDYTGMEAMEGMAPIEGAYGGRSFFLFFLDLEVLQPFVGRLSGVSGTPYATAGLMSAIGIFGLASGRRVLAALAIVALLLSSTGSAVLALFASAALLYRKRLAMYVSMLLLIPFLLWVVNLKIEPGTLRNVYLPVSVASPIFEMIVATVIGEGRHTSSIHTEIRVIGMLLSLGMVGVVCIVSMLDGWRRGLRLPRDPDTRKEYQAVGYFVLTLFFSTVHYPALFIYPNIAFVVAFLALVSSRLRIARAAKGVVSGARIVV